MARSLASLTVHRGRFLFWPAGPGEAGRAGRTRRRILVAGVTVVEGGRGRVPIVLSMRAAAWPPRCGRPPRAKGDARHPGLRPGRPCLGTVRLRSEGPKLPAERLDP